ncbi:MAG: hypothetical protein KatS3mg090_0544 [Patescibacteria group bacterium]|nr:MAG: hypothetical protein KatS3mg090_0544 [Patescibacteria group bacterium]
MQMEKSKININRIIAKTILKNRKLYSKKINLSDQKERVLDKIEFLYWRDFIEVLFYSDAK